MTVKCRQSGTIRKNKYRIQKRSVRFKCSYASKPKPLTVFFDIVRVLGEPTMVMGMDNVMGLVILTPCKPDDATGCMLTLVDLTVDIA